MVDSMGFLDLKLKIGKSTCWLLYSEALVDFSLLFVVKNLVHVDGVSLKCFSDPILRDSEAAKEGNHNIRSKGCMEKVFSI
ncbi:hypothetical protein IGI04_031435 [Brassica rapa subsp. trilocularis]|uniref:Uncharacterized protein n=1 Tax=Brassica rapa subsp. trilocularis TaxID=1813537 RepID=A0ABQ7LWW8_BRACM|nr:hypothetical protein IGI04_031435 [Brassica rapa subsp. trilocularis]